MSNFRLERAGGVAMRHERLAASPAAQPERRADRVAANATTG